MANGTYGFRTSVGGFHKGDVIGYIEKMNTEHRTEILEYESTINSLRDEIRSLNQQLNILMMATPVAPEKVSAGPVVGGFVPAPEEPEEVPASPVAEPEKEFVPFSLETVEEPVSAPEPAPSYNPIRDFVPLSFAPAKETEPSEETEPVSEPVSAQSNDDLMMKELRAYRRAEAVERSARTQLRKLCDQMENMCSGTMDEFNATNAAVKQTVSLLMDQAKALEESYTAFSSALQSSREKLASMNDMFGEDPEE